MPAREPLRVPHPDTGAGQAQTREQALRLRLEQRRLALLDEMRQYPAPIAGCDQQFNWLLDQCAHVQTQLQRLDAVCAGATTPEQLAEQLEAFDPEGQPRESYPHDTVHSR
jgi:hypothetical protein